ncbi:sulfur oxidation c-type cytochrome SoxX [Maritalea mobilis]|uniref:sulfur oxidation c-type cytochrome SoxX n=1 Tax=Maritalea mobilis TaxID=483324 RepID=UPI001C93CFAB|nr:sulfur oxidation c-type cytochrome SoxX [Maritalea mobilis]MBY6200915.1 sulfur oxidation c-type cytochrome SoxX [Maritalea mobilis]
MTRKLLIAAVFGVAATALHADVIAPDDVAANEYGEVEVSLTGMPGDPVRGEEVMTDRGLGNCIACHQVTALDDYPFHGEVGPTLDGAADRWTEAALRGMLVNADNIFPDSAMPSFYRVSGFVRPGNGYTGRAAEGPIEPILSAQQVEDVVAYLLTLTE